jgi:hypothetical protein
MRLDGKYYCSIYPRDIQGQIAFTDDYNTEGEAMEAAKELILGYPLRNEEPR